MDVNFKIVWEQLSLNCAFSDWYYRNTMKFQNFILSSRDCLIDFEKPLPIIVVGFDSAIVIIPVSNTSQTGLA